MKWKIARTTSTWCTHGGSSAAQHGSRRLMRPSKQLANHSPHWQPKEFALGCHPWISKLWAIIIYIWLDMKQRETVCSDGRLKIKTLQVDANLMLDWCQRSASEILQHNGKSTPMCSVPRVAQAVRGQHPDFRLVYIVPVGSWNKRSGLPKRCAVKGSSQQSCKGWAANLIRTKSHQPCACSSSSRPWSL